MKKSVFRIRPASAEDYPSIAGVLDRSLGARPFDQRVALWNWRYDDNPAGTGVFPPFLVAEEQGRIIGVQGMIPLRLRAGNTILPISCSCDLAVDADSRSAGMKLKLSALSKEMSPLHLSTSANEAANRITVALGGKEIASCRRKWILPLKASGLGGRILGDAGATLLRPADLAMAALRFLKRPAKVPGGDIVDIGSFDSRYDRFWEETAQNRAIHIIRDSAYLSWRYTRYPFPGIQSFRLSRRDVLLGFASIHIALDPDGLRFAAILDLATRKGEQGPMKHLLGEAIRRAAEAGAHYVTGRTMVLEEEKILSKSGFLLRESSWSPATYKNNSDVPESLFSDDGNWYLALGDGDGCYYY